MPIVIRSFLAAACLTSAAIAQTPAPASPPAAKTPAKADDTSSVKFTVETVAENLEVPWSIVFAPDGRVFITERPGRLRVIENGALKAEPVFTVPDVVTARGGEIGLMGLCLHPDFDKNHFLYMSYGSKEKDIRVVRYVESKGTLTEPLVIVKGMPAGVNHAGCRIKFGPDRKLYITTGEKFQRELAQDMTSLGGKILRVNDDGSIPADNPFVLQKEVRPEIWSFGHRNPQGIDWQPHTDFLFSTEHGPSGSDAPGGGDEFNLVEKGKNYGWPVVHHDGERAGMVSPLIEWTPAVAPGSGMFYTGAMFPDLKGNFLVGALRDGSVIRIILDGSKVVKQEKLLKGYGRIRDVAQAPDGSIYVSTSNRDGRGRAAEKDDRILRLVPKKD